MDKIKRSNHLKALQDLLQHYPVVALLGARQVGKTTLAHQIKESCGKNILWLDLEDPRDLNRLQEPMLTLEPFKGLIIIDEVQNRPELFPILRVLADRPNSPAKFLILGSASPELLRQGSETLAGRIAFYELEGFNLKEVSPRAMDQLWLRGGFPRSYLSKSESISYEWRQNFIRTYVERDLPNLGIRVPARTIDQFFRMLAHYHGQVFNASELGRAFGVSHTTVNRYLSLLEQTMVIKVLRPWYENLGKRLIRSPKIYIADPGILHTLLGIRNREELETHPKLGASWEGFLLSQLIQILGVEKEQAYFFGTHAGAELDLLILDGQRRHGYEFKRTDTPKLTKSMRSVIETLRLDTLKIIHAGKQDFPISKKVQAISAYSLLA